METVKKHMEGERSRPLCPVNPQKLFNGQRQYHQGPASLLFKPA